LVGAEAGAVVRREVVVADGVGLGVVLLTVGAGVGRREGAGVGGSEGAGFRRMAGRGEGGGVVSGGIQSSSVVVLKAGPG